MKEVIELSWDEVLSLAESVVGVKLKILGTVDRGVQFEMESQSKGEEVTDQPKDNSNVSEESEGDTAEQKQSEGKIVDIEKKE